VEDVLQEQRDYLDRSLDAVAEDILEKIRENRKYLLSSVMAEKAEEQEEFLEKYKPEIYYVLKEKKKPKRGVDEEPEEINFKAIYLSLMYKEEIVCETVLTVEKLLELCQESSEREKIEQDLHRIAFQRSNIAKFLMN
jgi:hypothetical protein